MDLGDFWFFSMDTDKQSNDISYCRTRKTFKINPKSGVQGTYLQLNLYWFKDQYPIFVIVGDAFPQGTGETYQGMIGFGKDGNFQGFTFAFQAHGQTVGGPITQQFLDLFKNADTFGIKVGEADLGAFDVLSNFDAVQAFDACIEKVKPELKDFHKKYVPIRAGKDDQES
jgi:hypothetical protein